MVLTGEAPCAAGEVLRSKVICYWNGGAGVADHFQVSELSWQDFPALVKWMDNNGMQRTALRAPAEPERYHIETHTSQ